MDKVNVSNVEVMNNPAAFYSPFQFEITFECIEKLEQDLEWKIIYVGSAESEAYDQILDSILVGPVPVGNHMFVFEADPPDAAKIPVADAVGVTVVLLTGSCRGHEFVRVGYYVNIEYEDPELRENPPSTPIYEKLSRNILATQPRVTKFKIDWDKTQNGPEMVENSITGIERDSIEAGTCRSPATSSTRLMNFVTNWNGSGNNNDEADRERITSSSRLEPPGPLLTPTNFEAANNGDLDSVNTPMDISPS